MNRGILATEYAKLTKDVTWEEVKAVYDKYYANEKLSAFWTKMFTRKQNG